MDIARVDVSMLTFDSGALLDLYIHIPRGKFANSERGGVLMSNSTVSPRGVAEASPWTEP